MDATNLFPVLLIPWKSTETVWATLQEPAKGGNWLVVSREELPEQTAYVVPNEGFQSFVNGPAYLVPARGRKQEDGAFIYDATDTKPSDLRYIFSVLNPGCRTYFLERVYRKLCARLAEGKKVSPEALRTQKTLSGYKPYPGFMPGK